MKKLILAALMSAPLFPAVANLVTNGSFESTPQAPGSWNVYQSINGWSSIGSGIEVRNNVAGTAYDGGNFVELDSHSNSSMMQALSGASGQYFLSFWYSARPGTSAVTNGLSFSLDGLELDSVLVNVGNATGAHDWQHYSGIFDFDGDAVLRFNAIGVNDSYGGSLDKVEFTAVPQIQSLAAVPEPGTYALAMVALAALGIASRKRKS